MFNKIRMAAVVAVCTFALLGCHKNKHDVQTSANDLPYYYEAVEKIKYPNLIDDPRQWAVDNLNESGRVTVEDVGEYADIDHDGVDELIICGDGGQNRPHFVFKKIGQQYRYIGDLDWISGYRILPLGDDGKPRIATFMHCSAYETVVSILKYDGKKFKTLSSEMLNTGDDGTDKDKRRLKELLGEEYEDEQKSLPEELPSGDK